MKRTQSECFRSLLRRFSAKQALANRTHSAQIYLNLYCLASTNFFTGSINLFQIFSIEHLI